jgi:lambda family phage portal protein
MLRGVAAGLGVAYHNLANDLENVNYSSARIGELDERDSWKALQGFWCEHLNQPLYEDWLRMQVHHGHAALRSGALEKYKCVYWQARRWAWVDPLKEVGAAIEGIQARITSRTRVAAENGVDLEDVADEIAAEEAMFKAKNIELAPIAPKATGIVAQPGVTAGRTGAGDTARRQEQKTLA